jgi:hypothetical protein
MAQQKVKNAGTGTQHLPPPPLPPPDDDEEDPQQEDDGKPGVQPKQVPHKRLGSTKARPSDEMSASASTSESDSYIKIRDRGAILAMRPSHAISWIQKREERRSRK